jgi:integrase
MASLFRPTVTRYHLPDGTRCTKDAPGAVKSTERSRTWWGRFTDRHGRRRQVRLSANKRDSEQLLQRLAARADLEHFGLADPFEAHRSRPLLEHLEDYRRFLLAKGNTGQYVATAYRECRRILEGCRFELAADLQPSRVVEFLAGLRGPGGRARLPPGDSFGVAELAQVLGVSPDSLRRLARRGGVAGEGVGKDMRFPRAGAEALLARRGRGIGAVQSNHYLTSVKGFTRWLVRDGRAAADPLQHLSRMNPDADRRHRRRALTADAFARFTEATAGGAPFFGLTGPDRLVLYTLAANTGFRAGELASLTPESFDLAAGPPTVTVAAAYSKRRREDRQRLRADVAEMMRQYLKGRPPGRPVWEGAAWYQKGAEMVRADLERAGIAYREADRVFDFHAIRGQFISSLAAGGVHPKVAQALARHSTITLTMDHYTHLDGLDLGGALDQLPGVGRPGKPQEDSPK